MADRITDKHLDALAERLNKLTSSPLQPYTLDKVTGRNRACIGNHHISHAYGGVCLHRMSNESGGVSCPLIHGHVPKRELYDAMRNYIAGFEAGKEHELKRIADAPRGWATV
jgi:hypothetical protein